MQGRQLIRRRLAIVEARPQSAAEAQAKPTANKRVRPPMAKHTPVFTRGHTKAMREFFGREPVHDDDDDGSAHPTKKQLKKTREMRTVYQWDSEEPPVKGPPAAPAQEGTSSTAPAPITSNRSSPLGSEPDWR